jgi:hypothetical protein
MKTTLKNIIFALALTLPLSLSAAIVDHGSYFQDTDTGLYWLKLTETRGQSYDETDAQTAVGQALEGWRFATLAEVESFIAGYGFPNQGRNCGDGWGNYCDNVDAADAELLEDLIRLLGDTLDAGLDETEAQNDVSPDGAGTATGLLGHRGDPGGSYYYHVYKAVIRDTELVDRVTGLPASDSQDAIQVRWDTAPEYGTNASFLVRTTDPTIAQDDPNDPNNLQLTVFDNLSPDDFGLTGYCGYIEGSPFPGLCDYDQNSWWSVPVVDYAGILHWGSFGLYVTSSFDTEGRPWVRITAHDYNNADDCEAGDTDLGNNWCRKETPAAEFGLTSNGIPDNHLDYGDDPDYGGSFSIDNVELEFIHSNIQIDFEPYNSANTVRPKSAYFITVGVKTLSTADGNPVDFDAATVDPATVQFGPARTPNIAYPLPQDFDGDGDADMMFGFRMENTGISCLDNSVTFVAKT